MQEELLYFPNVLSLTVRLNTDRPETIFEAKSNILVPPVNAAWIKEFVKIAMSGRLGALLKKKKQIYGQPGEVSKGILTIMKKYLDENSSTGSLYPWLHQRLKL
jgi:UDP-N-acetylglucosamine 2-epimerase